MDDHSTGQVSFAGKVVFLTGATGNVGGCILYKLITQLGARQVYVLSRHSKERTQAIITQQLPTQARRLFNSLRIEIVHGDITLPSFGLAPEVLRRLQQRVDTVIHTAAVISLGARIDRCIRANCDPTLELARLATAFEKLERFVHVSTAYVNTFLQDGIVEERLYPLTDNEGEDIDAEEERHSILKTGDSKHTHRFAWPYSYSKYLAERLLVQRYPDLPLLIVRPSIIGPALRQPFRLYGDPKSQPLTFFLKLYMADKDGSKVWRASPDVAPGSNIIDEVPVDWVANVLLQHAAAGTRGVVHATAETYSTMTFNDLERSLDGCVSPDMLAVKPVFHWSTDRAVSQCALAEFFAIGHRNWVFDCRRSAGFKDRDGPLSIKSRATERHALITSRYLTLVAKLRKEGEDSCVTSKL